jgi:hypothetical protein
MVLPIGNAVSGVGVIGRISINVAIFVANLAHYSSVAIGQNNVLALGKTVGIELVQFEWAARALPSHISYS